MRGLQRLAVVAAVCGFYYVAHLFMLDQLIEDKHRDLFAIFIIGWLFPVLLTALATMICCVACSVIAWVIEGFTE